jgi:selenocysteine-specific elongation factor
MIIATAGHVDHGKTLLVKAITGVDADRLPEEKQRGMTIDLGFAYLPVEGSETLGFIDVPGHEKFIHNMLAGVAGIDFVMFVIAADDGLMPQTREHLAIVDLLGIQRGAIALTKIDRVEYSRVADVKNEIERLLAPTSLAGAPIYPVSAITGEGVGSLKAHLLAEAQTCWPRTTDGNFRMAVDRCFRISGAGLIVTGTVVAGLISAGDPVRMLGAGLALRARMIHAQNAASQTGRAGQRCAINLAGLELKPERIERGDWVVTGEVPESVHKFDARLRVLGSEPRTLANWTPVHVHHGAVDVTGRVAILEGSSIAPGASGLVQMVLDRPIGALYGDGLIVRDQSAQRTIGGGRVIDVFPPVRGRAKPERLAYLRAMDNGDTASAFSSVLQAATGGLNLNRFARNRNLTPQAGSRLFAATSTRSVDTASGACGFSPANWNRLKTTAVETLRLLHGGSANVIPSEERVFKEAGLRVPREVAAAVMAELVGEGAVERDASGVRLRGHVAQLNPADAALWKRAAPLLNENNLRPPTVHEIAGALGLDPRKTQSFLVRVSRLGLLVRTSENRFFTPAGLLRHATFTEEVAAGNGGAATAGRLRDRAGIGRTLAIEILEYFDRAKFTRRVGDEHRVLRSAQEIWRGGEGDLRYNNDESSSAGEKRTPVGRSDFKSGERR